MTAVPSGMVLGRDVWQSCLELRRVPLRYGFVIDQDLCIGCHACTVACKTEHDVPLGVNRTWVKYIEKGAWPDTRRFFSVMRCNHCADAPCVTICPTSALFTRADGIVDFDTSRCIGCKACMQACPYDALYIDPNDHTAQKCNYCVHRVEVGLEPACVVVCPVQAIIAGDLENPASRIAKMVATERLVQRAPEQGTRPQLWYKGVESSNLDPLAAVELTDGGIWRDPAASWLNVDLTQPASVVNGKPASVVNGKPASVVNGKPGSVVNGKPGSVVNGKPGSVVNGKPGSVVNGKPGSVVNGKPGSVVNGKPGSVVNGKPGSVVNGKPASVVNGKQRSAAKGGDAAPRVVYNTDHPMPWGWRVSSYFLTKGIAAGIAITLAIALLGGSGVSSRWAEWGAPLVAGVCLLATGVLLIWDLKRPERFWYLLTKGNPRSWLVRGSWILGAYALVLVAWFVAGVAGNHAAVTTLIWIAAVLGLGVAGYTAFLFGQAEGRDLWQSPTLLWHMLAAAVTAGGATGAVSTVIYDLPNSLERVFAWSLLGGAIALGLIAAAELVARHPTRNIEQAAHHMTRGRYALEWWVGGQVLGVVVPVTLVALHLADAGGVSLAALGGLAALAGIWFTDDAFVKAGQSVPLS